MRGRAPFLALLGLFVLRPAGARADSGSILPVYLDGASAPAPVVAKIDERLRAILAERGLHAVDLPASAPPDSRLAGAKKDLERGIAAYRALSLDNALPALAAAETGALAISDSPEAPRISADARIYLGLIALATGKDAEAARRFREVALADPDRRIDSKQFPPETVAAYEKARKAVAASPAAEITLPAGAQVFVDGRAVTASSVKLNRGEHLFLALSDAGTATERIDVNESRVWKPAFVLDTSRALAALRIAMKKGDEATAARAADQLATSAGATRILLWDLKSASGHVAAELRLRDAGSRTIGFPQSADIGSTATADAPLRTALSGVFGDVAPTLALHDEPTPARTPATRTRSARSEPHKLSKWVWIAAGGVALAAAAGGAATLAPAPASTTRVAVTVEK